MSDASSYDKDTGYYRGTPSPDTTAKDAQQQHQQQQNLDLITVPWDDDNFSLCLDSFPSSRLARTKYNQYPTTASPLRKHWGSSSNSSSSEEVNMDDEEVIRTLNAAPLPGLVEVETKATVSRKKVSKTTTTTTITTLKKVASNSGDMVAGAVFPYKNNGNFLTRINSEKRPPKITTQRQQIQRSSSSNSNRSRVEHISPLSNSSIIFQNDNDIFNKPTNLPRPSLTHKLSNASVKSRLSDHSATSFPTANRHQQDHFNCNSSQFSSSQYSDNGESWKVVSRRYASSAIVVKPSISPVPQCATVDQQYQGGHLRTHSPLLLHDNGQDDHTSVRSGNITYNRNSKMANGKQYSNSLGSFGGFFTPQISPAPSIATRDGDKSVSSYHSIAVSRNADKLVLYSEDGSPSHNDESPSSVKNRNSTYSQVFDPAYNGKRKKSYHKKVPASIFTKLVKKLKQHFIKSTTTTTTTTTTNNNNNNQ